MDRGALSAQLLDYSRACCVQLLANMPQQSITGILNQIQYLVEPLVTSMIRIGHHRHIVG